MGKSSSRSKPLALVTGASSGIGEVFARKLAEAGYDLLLVARREEKLKAVQRDIGGEILPADLATDAGIHAVEDRIRQADNLDFLVNNAGFGTKGLFWNAKDQDTMHRLHVLATVCLTHAALPQMVARDRGHVINVSSVAAFSQNVGSVSYCATKAWMNSFTDGLHLELKTLNSHVRVQALCPGFTHSEFHEAAHFDKTQIPESLWMSADEIVDESFRGLAHNELFVVPGWRYKTWVALQKALPRAAVQAIATRSQAKFRKLEHA